MFARPRRSQSVFAWPLAPTSCPHEIGWGRAPCRSFLGCSYFVASRSDKVRREGANLDRATPDNLWAGRRVSLLTWARDRPPLPVPKEQAKASIRSVEETGWHFPEAPGTLRQAAG
jgi:hypothetical protein